MWKKFKWDMFVTSFIPLWISIAVVDIWDIITLTVEKWNNKNKIIDNLLAILGVSQIQVISIVIISIVVICSVYGINSFLKELGVSTDGTRGTIVGAIKLNKLSSEFLLAYILPMITFNFGDIQNITLFLIYFAVLAYLCIRNNNIYIYKYSFGI